MGIPKGIQNWLTRVDDEKLNILIIFKFYSHHLFSGDSWMLNTQKGFDFFYEFHYLHLFTDGNGNFSIAWHWNFSVAIMTKKICAFMIPFIKFKQVISAIKYLPRCSQKSRVQRTNYLDHNVCEIMFIRLTNRFTVTCFVFDLSIKHNDIVSFSFSAIRQSKYVLFP